MWISCVIYVLCLSCFCVCSHAGKGLTSWLLFVMFNCVFVTFLCGLLGQVRYFIVSIPDLCRFFTFKTNLSLNASQKYCRMFQGEHFAILLTFINLTFAIKIFIVYIIELPYCSILRHDFSSFLKVFDKYFLNLLY